MIEAIQSLAVIAITASAFVMFNRLAKFQPAKSEEVIERISDDMRLRKVAAKAARR